MRTLAMPETAEPWSLTGPRRGPPAAALLAKPKGRTMLLVKPVFWGMSGEAGERHAGLTRCASLPISGSVLSPATRPEPERLVRRRAQWRSFGLAKKAVGKGGAWPC